MLCIVVTFSVLRFVKSIDVRAEQPENQLFRLFRLWQLANDVSKVTVVSAAVAHDGVSPSRILSSMMNVASAFSVAALRADISVS